MKTIAVCIATYQRPVGLDRLLTALFDQQAPPGWCTEVRVVNNDPECNYSEWAADLKQTFQGVMTKAEPRRNIACARNTGIAMAPADAFAFIDDDEVPSAGWMEALVLGLQTADAVFGPVVGRVPDCTPAWLMKSGAFDKLGPDDPGPIHWTQTRTSSTAIWARWIGRGDRWFAPEYGNSGGSDVEFFRRIALQGAKFVHAHRALVYEDVEPERCNWQSVLRRRYRAGAVLGRMHAHDSQFTRWAQLVKRVAAGTAIGLLGFPEFATGRPARSFHGLCKATVGVGAWRGHNRRYTVTRYHAKSLNLIGGTSCASPS